MPKIWDFTYADTLCKSYVKKASKEVGSAAARREDKKVEKYSNLSDHYHFVPVGIETYGAYGPQGIKLVKQIGKKIQDNLLIVCHQWKSCNVINRQFFYTKADNWRSISFGLKYR